MPAIRGESAEGLRGDRVRQRLQIQHLPSVPPRPRKFSPSPQWQSQKGPVYVMNCMLRCESHFRMADTSSLGRRNRHGAEQKKEIRQWSQPWNRILGWEIDSPAET